MWYKCFVSYKNETAHCVKGIHQPIVSEELFDEYLSHGGEIMKRIATRYIAAPLIGKKQFTGFICPEKTNSQRTNFEPQNKRNIGVDKQARTRSRLRRRQKKAGDNL